MALWQTQSICELLTLYKDTMTAPYQSSGTSNDIQHKLHKNHNKSKTHSPLYLINSICSRCLSTLHTSYSTLNLFRTGFTIIYFKTQRFTITWDWGVITVINLLVEFPNITCGWSVKISPSFENTPFIILTSRQKSLVFSLKLFFNLTPIVLVDYVIYYSS